VLYYKYKRPVVAPQPTYSFKNIEFYCHQHVSQKLENNIVRISMERSVIFTNWNSC